MSDESLLSGKLPDRRYLKKGKIRPVTCVIGAVCHDGIVLVGDTKVTIGPEARYRKKIIPVPTYRNFVVASAGLRDVMGYFLQDIENIEELINGQTIVRDPARGFLGLIEDVVARLYRIYAPRYVADAGGSPDAYTFEAFACWKPEGERRATLRHISRVGTSSLVEEFEVLGSGRPYALPFLKAAYGYGRRISMKQIAVVSALVIVLIDTLGIDDSIGGDPQIWMFPNRGRVHEVMVDTAELADIVKEVSGKRFEFTAFLGFPQN